MFPYLYIYVNVRACENIWKFMLDRSSKGNNPNETKTLVI